ncbi:hypothetical protein SUGI_0680260 [Cryptomeria japonica]|nr:hypothetical protein SUGI_0680260 [Cryptomeria japonica]
MVEIIITGRCNKKNIEIVSTLAVIVHVKVVVALSLHATEPLRNREVFMSNTVGHTNRQQIPGGRRQCMKPPHHGICLLLVHWLSWEFNRGQP